VCFIVFEISGIGGKVLGINLKYEHNRALQVLCLGAHSDDIEIGCGATIRRLIREYPNLRVHWVVFGSKGVRTEEALKSAEKILADVEDKKIIVKGFRDSFFPYIGTEVKEYFEEIKGEMEPDIIFTHYGKDFHQDHRLLSELTWNTFRNHFILEYEIPKYDGDLGSPNFFVHLDESICQWKAEHLMLHFKTQLGRHWFTNDTFLGLLRLRGIESKSPGGYAEAFHCRKVTY
jgi:LmbE family N-acetylglucosaminyl deacetylase